MAQQAYLKASNSGEGDQFGLSVAVSGDTAVVGAWQEDSSATSVNGNQTDNDAGTAGAAYVFTRSGNTWIQQAYLKASNAEAGDAFGGSVAISSDTIVVGAAGEDGGSSGVNGDQSTNNLQSSGAAYVFVRVGSVWSQQAYLKASDPDAIDLFFTVSISGDTVVVGAYGDDRNSTGVNGDQTSYGASSSGAAYVFARMGGNWTQKAYLKASNTNENDSFGRGVAVSGNTVIVGAHDEDSNSIGVNGDGADNSTLDAGASYIFDLNAMPEIAVELAGAEITSGSTQSFGFATASRSLDHTFTLQNTGLVELILVGNPKAEVTGSIDFSVLSQPDSPITSSGSTTFSVRFIPTSGGAKEAVLSIFSNDVDDTPFTINLSGTGLSFSADTDGDGLSDASEFNMFALGFDWQLEQVNLVATFKENANGAGYFTPTQLQALKPETPLIARDPVTGKFTLTMDWKKSTDLSAFTDFPAPAGSAVSISPGGDIQFEFTAPDPAAFFRIEVE